jgi:hypothetical protein
MYIYIYFARPILTHGSKAWRIRKADERRLSGLETKFMRTEFYTLEDQKKMEKKIKIIKIQLVIKFIQGY